MTQIKAVLRVRRGSYDSFVRANPKLMDGEITVVTVGSGEHGGKVKVGDGLRRWTDLPFVLGTAGTIQVGSIETGEAGTQAMIINRGSNTEAVLDFIIPKGDMGTIGSVLQIGENGNWFIDEKDTGVFKQCGQRQPDGMDGGGVRTRTQRGNPR